MIKIYIIVRIKSRQLICFSFPTFIPWKAKVLVAQSLRPHGRGSSVHEVLQARILERAAIPFSRGSSQPRDQTWVSRTAGRLFTIWATGKPLFPCSHQNETWDMLLISPCHKLSISLSKVLDINYNLFQSHKQVFLYSCIFRFKFPLVVPVVIAVVQSLNHVWLFVTPRTVAHQSSLFITISQSMLKLVSIKSVMPSNHLIFCHPLLLPPSIFPSIRVFSNEPALRIRWPKYWSFSFSISPSNEHSGLISFRMDWLDLLAVWQTLKNLLQHHSSKASILWRSAFFIVQLSHPYMTTGKTIALIRWTFVGKVMSLLFNMLSRLVIAFLPRNKHLLISWL